jgi:hypothetical protein
MNDKAEIINISRQPSPLQIMIDEKTTLEYVTFQLSR